MLPPGGFRRRCPVRRTPTGESRTSERGATAWCAPFVTRPAGVAERPARRDRPVSRSRHGSCPRSSVPAGRVSRRRSWPRGRWPDAEAAARVRGGRPCGKPGPRHGRTRRPGRQHGRPSRPGRRDAAVVGVVRPADDDGRLLPEGRADLRPVEQAARLEVLGGELHRATEDTRSEDEHGDGDRDGGERCCGRRHRERVRDHAGVELRNGSRGTTSSATRRGRSHVGSPM